MGLDNASGIRNRKLVYLFPILVSKKLKYEGKMKKLIRLIAFIFIVITPIWCFVICAESINDPYSNTYLGAFDEKYSNLYNTVG